MNKVVDAALPVLVTTSTTTRRSSHGKETTTKVSFFIHRMSNGGEVREK
jgi:hypothetical protein